jgi:release factor glutamine methyltransferase
VAFWRELPHSFDEALRVAKEILNRNPLLVQRGVVNSEAEQIVLAAYRQATGILLSRMELFSRIKDRFPEKAAHLVLVWSGSRAEGKLLQHLTGIQVFLDHEYEVNSDVLVPRPETEGLVEAASLEFSSRISPQLGMEIGLGSGILSIELLTRFPKLKMIASELTEGARQCAQRNANRILGPDWVKRLNVLAVAQVNEVFGVFQSVVSARSADFIISNPPYVVREDEMDAEVLLNEPHPALFAPSHDPLFFYREIANQAGTYLKSGGFVFTELPHERANAILKLFCEPKWNAKLLLDLNQRDRVLVAQLKE